MIVFNISVGGVKQTCAVVTAIVWLKKVNLVDKVHYPVGYLKHATLGQKMEITLHTDLTRETKS